jgi:hypothetical protein
MLGRMIGRLIPLGCCAAITIGAAATLAAAETADSTFTYQGQLRQGGDPVTSAVNLSFRLHADEVADDQVGDTLDAFGFDFFDDEGRFTLDLDFGDEVFDGTALWLEIWVNGAPLVPRQPIMPTPYAIRALSVSSDGLAGSYANQIDLKNPANNISGNFDGNGSMLSNLNASNLSSGTIGSSLLSGSYTNSVNFNNTGNTFSGSFTGTYSGSGAALTNLNANNIGTGNLNIARMPTGGNWNLSSNLNIGTGVMFLNNANSRVGIGTTVPNSRLHVNSDSDEVAFRAQIAGLSKFIVAPTGGVSVGANQTNPPENGLYVAGRTGIGLLPEAASQLDILTNSTLSQSKGIRVRHQGNAGFPVAGRFESTGHNSGIGVYAEGRSRGIEARATESGTVFAGDFEVPNGTGGGAAVRGQNFASGGLAYGGYFTASSNSGAGGIGVLGWGTGFTGTNYGVYGATNSNSGYAGYFVGGRNYFEGPVGIGNTNPGDRFNINADADENAMRVVVGTTTRFRIYGSGGVGIGSNMLSSPPPGGDLSVSGAVAINISGNDASPFRLAVNGTCAKPGGGSWAVLSDARLKQDITPLGPGMLDRLLTLNGYTYEYDKSIIGNGLALPGEQMGLLAQEVVEVFPDWIGEDNDGYMHVTERAITAIMVEALRDLRNEKDAEIAELHERVDRLEALLAAALGIKE